MALNKNDLRQEILTNELGSRMLDMVAPVYDRSKVFLFMFQAFGIVLQKEMDFIWDDLIAQMLPQTTTWGIESWEDEYGIIPEASWTIEERRSNLLSYMRTRAPITPKKIADRLSLILGSPVKIRENISKNMFEVVTEEYISDLSEAIDLLNTIAPAHLIYRFHAEVEVQSHSICYCHAAISESESFDVVVKLPMTDFVSYYNIMVSETESFEVAIN